MNVCIHISYTTLECIHFYSKLDLKINLSQTLADKMIEWVSIEKTQWKPTVHETPTVKSRVP